MTRKIQQRSNLRSNTQADTKIISLVNMSLPKISNIFTAKDTLSIHCRRYLIYSLPKILNLLTAKDT